MRRFSARAGWRLSVGCLAAVAGVTVAASAAFAQSTQGPLLNSASAQSMRDAVDQNQKDLLDGQVVGKATTSGSLTGGVTGALGASAFPSGRLRASDHDGFVGRTIVPSGNPFLDGSGPSKTFSFQTHEASVFANALYSVPGTVFGGQVKVSGFVGYNWLSLELTPNVEANANVGAPPGQIGNGENKSVLAGLSLLWATQGGTYLLGTAVGTWGETTLVDKIGDCFDTFCNHNQYRFNTKGFIGSVTAGQVFDLAGASGPKLDVRGTLGYTRNIGATFANVFGDEFELSFSTWTGTGSVTLFSNMAMPNNALLRPYIQVYARQEWNYRNRLAFTQFGSGDHNVTEYEQAHLFRGLDAGFTYAVNDWTFGAAAYVENSTDQTTVGGRLGASLKLGDDASKRPASEGPFSWTGFYIGANAGKAWNQADARGVLSCAAGAGTGYFCERIDPAPPVPPVVDPAGTAKADAVGKTASGAMDASGFTGGLQAGGNWQKGAFVFGIEVDVGSLNLNGSRSASGITPGDAFTHTVSTTFETGWLATARARLGVALSSMLVYATAGVAVTELSTAVAYKDTQGTTMDAAARDIKAGIVVGGGLEWALSRNWSLKGEYLFVDFGRVTAFGSIGDPATGPANPFAVSSDLSTHIARVGLNYKF